MLTYATESFTACEDEFSVLAPFHFHEVEMDQDDVPLALDYPLYRMMDDLDKLHMTTARDAKGRLVGYLIAIISFPLHHSTTLHGIIDIAYLHPDYRRGRAGLRLYSYTEKVLQKRGVIKMYGGCKKTFDLTSIFTRMGYVPAEQYFSKVLA